MDDAFVDAAVDIVERESSCGQSSSWSGMYGSGGEAGLHVMKVWTSPVNGYRAGVERPMRDCRTLIGP
jgi:hypothetical protein